MTDRKVDLKVFIRNFANQIPKNRNKEVPLIRITFRDDDMDSGYSEPIYVYRIESLKVIHYRYSCDPTSSAGMQLWSIPDVSYLVDSVIPPEGRRSILGGSISDSLGTLRVRYRN